MMNNIRIFIQFMYRDIIIYRKHFLNDLINYALLCPVIFSVSNIYLQANVYFGTDHGNLGTVIFAGNILIPIMIITYKLTFSLLFDLENNKYVNYQIILLNPRLVIVQRIIFAALTSFIICLPFFPVSQLILGQHFLVKQISWIKLILLLCAGSFCAASYNQFFASFLRSNQIGMFWVRINHVALALGGAFVSTTVIQTYSPFLGYLIRLNPLLYLTEGVRQILLGSDELFPFSLCISVLLLSTLLFIRLTWWTFKRRVDHI